MDRSNFCSSWARRLLTSVGLHQKCCSLGDASVGVLDSVTLFLFRCHRTGGGRFRGLVIGGLVWYPQRKAKETIAWTAGQWGLLTHYCALLITFSLFLGSDEKEDGRRREKSGKVACSSAPIRVLLFSNAQDATVLFARLGKEEALLIEDLAPSSTGFGL